MHASELFQLLTSTEVRNALTRSGISATSLLAGGSDLARSWADGVQQAATEAQAGPISLFAAAAIGGVLAAGLLIAGIAYWLKTRPPRTTV